MSFICPAIGEGHERDFLVSGSPEDFKIIVFSDMEEYEKGYEFLKLSGYEPCEVSMDLFKSLAENDDEFVGNELVADHFPDMRLFIVVPVEYAQIAQVAATDVGIGLVGLTLHLCPDRIWDAL